MNRQLQAVFGVLIAGLLFLTQQAEAAQLIYDLPWTNSPSASSNSLKSFALSNQFTKYTSVSNNDAKFFRGVFTPTTPSSKLAVHSDDGSTVSIDGIPYWSGRGDPTSLQNADSFYDIPTAHTNGTAFVAGREYCIEIDYLNGMTNVNDRDGVTLYAYDGGGDFRNGLILRSTNDAVCVGGTMTLNVSCGTTGYGWSSSVPATATMAGSGSGNSIGTITGLKSGTVSITATDSANLIISRTINIVKPGISPAFLTNCVGLTNTFVLTNSAGTGTVTWSKSGLLIGNTRTNQVAFTNPGANVLTADYAGCLVSATVTVVAVTSLLPVTTNFCNSGMVVYTNQTTAAGFSQFANWGGEGLFGTGASRTNSYSSVGPHIVSNWCGTSVKYSTATVYHIDIAQTGATVLADATASVTFYLTNSYGAATWQIAPSPSGGASFAGGNSGDIIIVNPGSVGTNYTITASADALSSCSDTATLQVVKVTFPTNLVAFCEGTNAFVAMTVTPSNFLSSLTFDTVTNVAAGASNTVASVTVASTTNLILTAVSPGTATLRVRLGASTFFGPVVKVVRVTFPTNPWYVLEGTSITNGVTIVPPDAPVVFTTKDASIATAGSIGTNVIVSGVSNGTTKVLAVVGTMTCAQKDVTVLRFTLTPTEVDVCVTQSVVASVGVLPAGIPFNVFTDTNIATVSQSGTNLTVMGVSHGVTALVADVQGSFFGLGPVYCYRVTFATNEFFVIQGNVNTLKVEVLPELVVSRILFVAANPNVASVSGGAPLLTITGMSNGMTQVQAWIGTN